MNWESFLTGAIGAGVISGILQLIEIYTSRNKTQAETSLNIAQAASEIVEGGDRAVESMKKVLSFYEERDAQKTKRIDEQDKELASLKAQIVSIRIDENAKEARLNTKIEALEQYIKLLIDTLRSHDIDIPPRPEILKESDPKIKAIK